MILRPTHAFALLLVAAPFFLPSGASAGTSSGAPGNRLRLIFISPFSQAKFFDPVKQGMNDAAAMMDVEAIFTGPTDGNVKAQEVAVRRAVKEDYDGIALNIIDPVALDLAVREAMRAGVPVVAFNVDDQATPNARLAAVNQHMYEAGRTVGEKVAPSIPPHRHVLLTLHDEGVSALDDRLRGQQDALRKSVKGIRWTVVVTGNDADKGVKIVADALRENPDIRVILGTGQADTAAAGLALERHFAGKGYWSAGFDLSPDILRLVKAGHIRFTVDQQPYIQGFYPVVQLTQYLRYGIMPADIDAGAGIIDQSNVDSVIALSKENYR